jgi:hypothetical protein
VRPSSKCSAEGSRIRAPQLAPDGDGFIWMPESAFAAAFAQTSEGERSVRRRAAADPRSLPAGEGSEPLWKTVYLFAEQDRMINPETQEFMARWMKATLRRLDVDHTPIATAPDRIVELLLEAGRSVSA